MIQKAEVQTLLYLLKQNEVLLIEKKRGLGKGFFNGVGGKVHENESIEEAIIRECIEEIKVLPKNIEWKALLEFINKTNKGNEFFYVHVFTCKEWEGIPEETEEAKPFWFKITELPFDKMWEDDKYWLPHVLEGKKLFASFEFRDWKLEKGKVFFIGEINELGNKRVQKCRNSKAFSL